MPGKSLFQRPRLAPSFSAGPCAEEQDDQAGPLADGSGRADGGLTAIVPVDPGTDALKASLARHQASSSA
jgi:hypothetical protein